MTRSVISHTKEFGRGVVRWFSVSRNYQVRPDPDDVLRAVRAL